jgi:hypothetical protein
MVKLLVPRGARSVEPEHISRLKSVAKWRMPLEGSPEWVQFRLSSAAAERDPQYRRRIKEAARTAAGTHYVVERNGAGLPADEGIREFLSEYNRRSANYGIHYLPSSFNIFEAFSDFVPQYGVFVPLNEIDHVCSVRGFLDYQASNDTQVPGMELEKLPENTIFNFSFTETPGDWIFEEAAEKFVVCSFSMVRHGNEITAMCLAGLERDLAAETAEIESRGSSILSDPRKPLLEPDASLTPRAVALDDDGKFHRMYAALRFDIRKQAIQVRYLLFDDGNLWNVKTDDSLTLSYVDEMSSDYLEEEWIASVEKRSSLFSFLLRLTGLNSYFLSRRDFLLSDKAITGLAEGRSSAKGRKCVDNSLRSQVVFEKNVSTLLGSNTDPIAVVLPQLELSVEVDGYWERLPFGTYGAGKDGERVLGRTWVRKTLSRRQALMPGAPVTGHLTERLSVSLRDDEGYIYVLRNAAHQLDMFKVGLTRRNVSTRASELSRGTGVPDAFLTVQSWWVPDVVYAEKRIHQLLEGNRVKPSREFFRADYSVIRAAVDLVVSELSGNSVPI